MRPAAVSIFLALGQLIAALAAASEPTPLPPGQALEREFSPREHHEYLLTLGRGQFGQVLVRQCGIDVSVELRSPEGRLLARRDETYSFGPETLSLVSEVSGTYRLEVTANRAAATPGRYEVRLDELRPFLPRYRKRVAAETATSLALSLREQSDPSARRRAREGLEGAVRMWRKLGDSRGEAFTLNALAWEERLAGNMPRALELALRALSLARKSGDRQLEGRVLTATGLLQALVGDPKGALEAEAHALPLVRSEGDQDAEAASLRYSGLAAWMMGDFQRALDWSNEALAVARQIQNGTEEAWSLFGIATAYWGMADYSSALRYYELALPLFQIVGDREGEMLAVNALGGTYISVGAPRRTLLLEQPALETIRSLGDRAEEAMALANIGQALADLGRGNEGLAPLARARAIWRAMGDRREVWSLWHLSRAQATIGLTEEALGSYRELLTFGRRIGDRGIEIEALTGIARLQEKRGDLEEARSRAEEALAIIESSRGAIQIEALRSLYTASRQAAYDVYADVLAALDETQQDHRFAEAAFAATERGRARALTEAIAEARLDLAGDLLPDLRKRELELSARLASLQNKAALAGGNRASVEEPLAEAEEEWDRLITEIRRATPRYASVQYPEPISADAVKELLDSTTALVSYSVRAARTLVFVVTHDRLELHRLPVSAPSLAERVENYVGLISRDDREPWSSLAAGLHADLVAPWRGRLPPAIRRLIIVPDGALHSLPFETLAPARLGAHRLVEDFAISYAPSATVLAQLETARARSMRERAAALLVLASPPVPQAIEQARGEIDGETFDLRPLSFAADEAKLVSRFGGEASEIRLGREASERRVRGPGMDRFEVIHFATHGLLNRTVPSRSALLLAGDPGAEPADGLLRARDIYRLRLSSELVVLSACQTARGLILPGEGVQGLAQAFFHAGARSVVASLWDVSDRRTADLMARFYGHLAGGEPKAEALRSAKLDLLRREPHLAPRYWAAFVLIGDPMGTIHLVQPRPPLGWSLVGAALGISLAFFAVSRRRRRRISVAG